jgi:hypothetical protein
MLRLLEPDENQAAAAMAASKVSPLEDQATAARMSSVLQLLEDEVLIKRGMPFEN